MPQHVFTIVARGHAVDVQSNALTLFSVLEEIGAPGLPVAVPQVSIVSLWRRQEGEEGAAFVQRTQLMDPDGNEVAHAECSFRLERPRHRVLSRINMVPFQRAGCYHFEILFRPEDQTAWSRVCSYPIEVRVSTHQPGGENALFDQGRASEEATGG